VNVSQARGDRAAKGRFHHEALFYAGADELLAGTVPFVRAGLEAGDAILLAMPNARVELVKGELGPDAAEVRFADMEEIGRNPARILPVWSEFLAANLSPARGVRGIGEPVWAGRSAVELEECRRHESLLNLAFADGAAWALICPYDVVALGDEVLAEAEHNHPALSRDGDLSQSGSYCDPLLDGDPFAGVLADPAGNPAELHFTIEELGQVRRFVAAGARQGGLGLARTEDLVLAANELATNSLQHGGGSGVVRVWREDDALLCDVRDGGRIDQPLVGRVRPRPDQAGGRGVWLANQLCDLVQIRSAASGSVVRLRMSLKAGTELRSSGQA
jgi:anti-sigma regulatory factor (Ser/Thr protein kinase)